MLTNKVFAPDYERTDEGWILYPTDVELRKRVFGQVRKHQAKMNLHLLGSIVDYVSEPEERIMDNMAGTGSILIAALAGRRVTMIEISEKYSGWIKEHLDYMETIAPGISSSVILINAPCQRVLPIPTNHIIFSPPYTNIMQKKKFSAGDITADLYGVDEDDFTEYSKQPLNVGNRNRFLYSQEMEKIYKLCYESVLPGGTMTVVIKDYIEQGQRVCLSTWVQRVCTKAGFLPAEPNKTWFKWKAPGSAFTNIYRSQGKLVVDDEDIMIFIKPEQPVKADLPAGYTVFAESRVVRQLVHAL